jgi:hypothetical protein
MYRSIEKENMMWRRAWQFQVFLGLAIGAVLSLTPSVSAARLLQVYIEQDGKVIAHTCYDDNGRADAAMIWRYLATPPIMVDEDIAAFEPDRRSLEVNLSGELVVRFQHTDRVIAQAQLSTLTLQRTDARTQAWFLPASEVERTAGVAGLGAPSGTPGGRTLSSGEVTIVVVAVLMLGAIAAVAFLILRRARGRALVKNDGCQLS